MVTARKKGSIKEEELEEGEDKSFSKAGKEIEKKGTKGVFTAKAKKAGMGVQEFARHVLANTDDFPDKTVDQASFAKGAATVAREKQIKMSVDYEQLKLFVKEAMFTGGGINEPSYPDDVPHRMPAADTGEKEQEKGDPKANELYDIALGRQRGHRNSCRGPGRANL